MRRLACVALAAAAIISGCGDSGDDSRTRELIGMVWQWQQTLYDEEGTVVPDDPSHYTVEFDDDGTVAIQADCNSLQGDYTVEAGAFALELGATTDVECEPGSLHDVFLADLSGAGAFRFDAGDLLIDIREDVGTMRFSLP